MNKSHIVDPNDLLMATETFVIDLLGYVSYLPDDLINALEPPAEGIYIPGNIEPVLKVGSEYYPKSKKGISAYRIHDLSKIFSIKEEIVDHEGRVITNPIKLFRLKKYITTQPLIPVVAVKVAKLVAESFIHSLCPVTKHRKGRETLFPYVRKEHHQLVIEEAYQVALDEMVSDLAEFVGKDTWHIYFTKLNGTSLVVEKTVDYRIYSWHQQQYESEHAA